jgi:hypothetical protein
VVERFWSSAGECQSNGYAKRDNTRAHVRANCLRPTFTYTPPILRQPSRTSNVLHLHAPKGFLMLKAITYVMWYGGLESASMVYERYRRSLRFWHEKRINVVRRSRVVQRSLPLHPSKHVLDTTISCHIHVHGLQAAFNQCNFSASHPPRAGDAQMIFNFFYRWDFPTSPYFQQDGNCRKPSKNLVVHLTTRWNRWKCLCLVAAQNVSDVIFT